VEPGGGPRKPPVHLHPRQQETFRVRSGKLSVTLQGQKQVYGPGDTLVIPAGTPHKWENESGRQELHFIWELAPAMQTASILETMGALAQAQKLNKSASAPFLQLALTLNKYPHHLLLAGIPAWLQRVLFKLLAPLALVLGYRPELDYKNVVAGKSLNLGSSG
jgi:hypothetical protein